MNQMVCKGKARERERIDVTGKCICHSSTTMSIDNEVKEKKANHIDTSNFIQRKKMNTTKAEAENIEPSAGKELLEKYWQEAKNEIEDINIV